MAVLYMDSFDHYTDLGSKGWWNYSSSISAGNGRWGTAGLYSSDDEFYVYRALGVQKTTLVCGGAFKLIQIASGFYCHCAAASDEYQCSTNIHADGFIYVQRGGYGCGPTEIGGPSSVAVPIGQWFYLETKYVIHDTEGEIEVHLNGAEVLHVTGVDTKYSTDEDYVSKYYPWRAGGHKWEVYMDDLYLDDSDFHGDVRIESIYPTGVGNYDQWTPSASGENYVCVDEHPPVTSDLISTSSVNAIDTYAFGNVTPAAGSVVAVAGNFYCQKNDAGSRQIALATRLSDTDDAGTGMDMPSAWGYLQQVRATKPGGGAWSISDVNSAEFGVKMTA